jgi:glucose-1-phosphate thymidylyltransferase
MKGILLAGGAGSRLNPTTKAISKHFMMIYDKPLIYYSLSNLMLAGIQEILLICTSRDLKFYNDLLGDGTRFGIDIDYKIQDSPNGIPEAFLIGETFVSSEQVVLALGDNIFYGSGFSTLLNSIVSNLSGSHILTKKVEDPNRFGVIGTLNGRIDYLEEKPVSSKSNMAITGLYFFDNTVSQRVKELKPSSRGELEIIDLLKSYQEDERLNYSELPRGTFWLDTGTTDSMLDASLFIRTIEQHTGSLIGSPEEIAFRNQWIDINELTLQVENQNGSYYKLLKKILLD